MANNRVILHLFQGFFVKMAPLDLARSILEHVQRESVEVRA
jgi:hypothetical protein